MNTLSRVIEEIEYLLYLDVEALSTSETSYITLSLHEMHEFNE
jgi:hypothetical protein